MNPGEGDTRREIIVPDSAHGTNPATAAMCGFIPVEVKSDERGGVDLAALKEVLGPQTAGLMLTNPNTLGLYDENISPSPGWSTRPAAWSITMGPT